VSLADELLSGWAPILRGVELVSGTKGRFEVTVDGELIFSKASLNRHAKPGEISAEVERRLGPRLEWRNKH
jgi:predicted Rdx family selenoprotein